MVPEAWRQPSEPCTMALRSVCVSACQLLWNNTGLSLSGDFATGWMGRSGRCGAQIWPQVQRTCRARHRALVSWWLWTGQVISLKNLSSQENLTSQHNHTLLQLIIHAPRRSHTSKHGGVIATVQYHTLALLQDLPGCCIAGYPGIHISVQKNTGRFLWQITTNSFYIPYAGCVLWALHRLP